MKEFNFVEINNTAMAQPDKFLLSVGMKTTDEKEVKEVTPYYGGADTEKIYTQEKSSSGLYSWFGEVLSASIASIGEHKIASEFFESLSKGKKIPEQVLNISICDVGNLMVQIQRSCWTDKIKNQDTICKWCGDGVTIPEIDLNELAIPHSPETGIIDRIVVTLDQTYIIKTGAEAFKDYEGHKYNTIIFRVPLLKDAIRHEKISGDEILFWRNIAFDCIVDLCYTPTDEESANGEPTDYIGIKFVQMRGKLLFNSDWRTQTLKLIREKLQSSDELKGVQMYYDDECPCPMKKKIPYFVNPSGFFS
jgi:hypothetical protein